MNAVIIYEKIDYATKARAMLENAADRTDRSTHWSVKPWRVDVLEYPPAAEAALREAAESHLIVLAVRQVHSLLPRLVGWLERWAMCRQIQEAALAVWEGGSADLRLGQALPELLEFARRHGLGIIFGDGELVENESSMFASDLPKHEVFLPPGLRHVREQPERVYHQHWGINE